MVADLRELVAVELAAARQRSLNLLDPLCDGDLTRQVSPIMSPLVWDLAHVGNYEELWLLRAVTGASPLDASLDPLYDAFRHPRRNRPALPLLGPHEARRYIHEVRGRVLDSLDEVELDGTAPLTRGGFVYGMVVQHEHMHVETMLATLQLMEEDAYQPPVTPAPAGRPVAEAERLVPGGPFTMGTDSGWAYDNERPAHEVDVAPFWIDTVPVTNARFREFIDDGGYRNRRWWGGEGWAWRCEQDAERPHSWRPDGTRVRFGVVEPVPADEPVQHVCWHEAGAFARWAGRRLPTEAEWEKAASGADAAHANVGQRHLRPAPVGAYPAGASRYGVEQLIGDVWEWTSSDFGPYPGFASFPYREYSEVFFGSGYKVLRGGSWATHPSAIRPTFRNWDHPVRRQIFAGFRCARDA